MCFGCVDVGFCVIRRRLRIVCRRLGVARHGVGPGFGIIRCRARVAPCFFHLGLGGVGGGLCLFGQILADVLGLPRHSAGLRLGVCRLVLGLAKHALQLVAE